MAESEEQSIEVELSLELFEELVSRASTMGLTASEYAACVLGKQMAEKE